jgi:hypothetical protein
VGREQDQRRLDRHQKGVVQNRSVDATVEHNNNILSCLMLSLDACCWNSGTTKK